MTPEELAQGFATLAELPGLVRELRQCLGAGGPTFALSVPVAEAVTVGHSYRQSHRCCCRRRCLEVGCE